MKKLLTILGSITLITTTSTAVIACKNINQQEIKNKETEQDKKESKESTDDKQKEKANESENDLKPNEHPQGDQPHNAQPSDLPRKNNEELVKNNKMNFYLIKKYGLEINNLLESSKNKIEELVKKPELGKVFKLISNLIQLYQELNKFDTLDKFANALKSQLENKQPKISYDEFLNEIFMQWQETITEYDKERDTILKLLK